MKKVLLVDDSDELRDAMAGVLRADGLEVITAQNGSEALEQLSQTTPNLLLMDVMMPDMDGWQLRRVMMSRPELSNLPVVVVSALEPRGELLEALKPVAALRKPFDPDRLLFHVRAALHAAQPRARGSRPASG